MTIDINKSLYNFYYLIVICKYNSNMARDVRVGVLFLMQPEPKLNFRSDPQYHNKNIRNSTTTFKVSAVVRGCQFVCGFNRNSCCCYSYGRSCGEHWHRLRYRSRRRDRYWRRPKILGRESTIGCGISNRETFDGLVSNSWPRLLRKSPYWL